MSLIADHGWMGVLLKLVIFSVVGGVGMLIEHKMVDWMGNIGAWVERLLTLGRYRPDPASWFSILFGFILTLIAIVWATGLFISHKLGGH